MRKGKSINLSRIRTHQLRLGTYSKTEVLKFSCIQEPASESGIRLVGARVY
jgi:hypothetical protein